MLAALQALQLGLTHLRSTEDIAQLELALHFLIKRAAAIQEAKATAEHNEMLASIGLKPGGASPELKDTLEATRISSGAGASNFSL